MNGFYLPPGEEISPGDIFVDVPFPLLRFPLSFFRPRPDVRQQNREFSECLTPAQAPPREGEDSPRGSLLIKTAMLLSHGCEVDNLLRKQSQERRHWLAAPIESFVGRSADLQRRVREGNQHNKFYLPGVKYLGDGEHFVDLRRITPINIPYFQQARKLCSLTETAQRALQSHLGVFFSGLALYLQPIACPTCGTEIDPAQFLVPSGEEETDD